MSTELVRQAEKPVVAMLTKYKGQIEAVLPKHLTPTRVLKMIVGSLNKNPKLLECTPMSVINAVLTASQLGLEIGPGQAYLIPYGKECQLVIDYRGKIDLALRSGKVLDIDLEIVYSREKFRIYRDSDGIKRIEHEPMLFKEVDGEHLPITDKDRGVPIGAYAVAAIKGGAPKIVFMPSVEIEAIRNRGKEKKDGPWVTDTMEMWKKTVCNRICKTLPSSAELRDVDAIETAVENGESMMRVIDAEEVDDVPLVTAGQGSIGAAVATADKTSSLAAALAAKRTAAPPVVEPSPEVKAAQEATVADSHGQRLYDAYAEVLGITEFSRCLGRVKIGEVTEKNYETIRRTMEESRKALDAKAAAQTGTPAASTKDAAPKEDGNLF